jgi:hypothetical protein
MNKERIKQTELLKPTRKARLKVEKKISAAEFIKEMEGCIKEGAPVTDPLKSKDMWEPTEK